MDMTLKMDSNAHFIIHTLTPAQKEEYEERIAILQFDAGLDEMDAGFEARKICMKRWAAKLE